MLVVGGGHAAALVACANALVGAVRQLLVARAAAADVLHVARYVVAYLVAAHALLARQERTRRTLLLPVTLQQFETRRQNQY